MKNLKEILEGIKKVVHALASCLGKPESEINSKGNVKKAQDHKNTK